MISIPVVRGKQNGIVVYQGNLTPLDLKDLIEIDRYIDPSLLDRGKRNGSQRLAKKSDIKNFAQNIIFKDSFCVNSIWLNDRAKTISFKSISKRDPDIGTLTLNGNCVLHVSDGQSRVLGLIKAVEEYDVRNRMPDFQMPVIITQMSRLYEDRSTIDINDHARKMDRTQRAAIKHGMMCYERKTALKNPVEIKEAIGFGAIMELDSTPDSPLYDMFVFPFKPKYTKPQIKADNTKKYFRKISSSSFIHAICQKNESELITFISENFFDDDMSSQERCSIVARIVAAFWKPLREITSKMWNDPDDYAFHSVIGSIANTCLLTYILRLMHKSGEKPNSQNFYKYLIRIPKLRQPDRWLNKSGITKHPGVPKHTTMADMRGISYGRVERDIMMSQLNNSLKLNKKKPRVVQSSKKVKKTLKKAAAKKK
jgi:DGQHR domain-containing protein